MAAHPKTIDEQIAEVISRAQEAVDQLRHTADRIAELASERERLQVQKDISHEE